MGTGFEMDVPQEHEGKLSISSQFDSLIGMIPRALRQIFDGIKEREDAATNSGVMKPEFAVSVQFMEIYNEEIIDLLNSSGAQRKIRIHEDKFGNIVADGLVDAKSTSFQGNGLSRSVLLFSTNYLTD